MDVMKIVKWNINIHALHQVVLVLTFVEMMFLIRMWNIDIFYKTHKILLAF